jgi:hypothetical protein
MQTQTCNAHSAISDHACHEISCVQALTPRQPPTGRAPGLPVAGRAHHAREGRLEARTASGDRPGMQDRRGRQQHEQRGSRGEAD